MGETNVCNLKEDRYCPAMGTTIQTGMRSKGIQRLELRDKNTFEVTRRMIVYKTTSKPKETPLLLNVCPWCREELGEVAL